MTTVTVIGGGASGLVAALTAARSGKRVRLLERQSRVGRKLSATGNGRCNLTNTELSGSHYHGRDPSFAESVLERFDTGAALDLFHSLGLLTVTEPDGRVYPLSDQAGSVVDVLRFAAQEAGVVMSTGFDVTSVSRKTRGGFSVCSESEATGSDLVIVCCGGMAGGRIGGTQSGYELLRGLGHSVTGLYPSLVQIKTDPAFVRALKGVRSDCRIALYHGSDAIAQSSGELQFTDFGVSGPAAFDLSRSAATSGGKLSLHMDLLRGYPLEEVYAILLARRDSMGGLTTENLLTGVLHNRLGRTVLRYAGYDLTTPVSRLSDGDLRRVSSACKDFVLPVISTLGFDSAQVTVGGARTSEFDPDTLQSRIVPGLYAAGEVLDVDGDCGGYNLQWAWASGHLAGLTL